MDLYERGFHENGSNSSLLASSVALLWNVSLFGEIPELPNTTLFYLQFYLSGIGGISVCLLGLIGNIYSIVIMTKNNYTKSSTFIYLTALTLSDSFVLVFVAFVNVKDALLMTPNQVFAHYHAVTFPYFHPLANTFQTISIWMTLGFTIDRYIMICHPFEGAKFCNRRRALSAVSLIFILGFLYNTPKFFEYETGYAELGGEKIPYPDLTDFGRSDFNLKVFHLWGYLLFLFIIPCTTLAALNIRLILAVRKSTATERKLSLGTIVSTRNDTTVMLVAVVVVFFVCQMPALISRTIWASLPLEIFYNEEYTHLNIITEISNFLVIVNAAVNIILYYAFSKKFRSGVARSWCKKMKHVDELPTSKRSPKSVFHQRSFSENTLRRQSNGLRSNSSVALLIELSSRQQSKLITRLVRSDSQDDSLYAMDKNNNYKTLRKNHCQLKQKLSNLEKSELQRLNDDQTHPTALCSSCKGRDYNEVQL